MSTVLAGGRTLRRSCAWIVAAVVVPVGNIKILVERVLEWVNGSWRVPAVEVAPVSLTADGMEPLLIPSLMVRGDMWVDVLWMLIVPVCLSG